MTLAIDARIASVRLGRRDVLHALELQVRPGEIVALVGPNGAGKTTLLRATAGLVHAKGEIRLMGQDISRLSPAQRARHVAYLAQNGQIHWPLPVRDIVALGRMPFGAVSQKPGAVDKAIVDDVITDCCLEHLATRPADELSGGERARVLLARALAVQAPILLADEPVAALDPALQIATMQILAQQAAMGRAVVLVMHDLGLALRIATRFVALRDGRIFADGEPSALLDSGRLDSVFGIGFARTQAEGIDMLAPILRR